MRRAPAVLLALVAVAWYLAGNPDVLRAAVAVVAAGLVAAFGLRRRRTLRVRRRVQTLGDLLTLAPSEFEEAVADLLGRSEFRDVRLCGGSGDLGADIVCVDRRGRTVVVQCKRHAPGIAVGSAAVQRFLGSVTHHGAERGLLVTTSRFTAPAIEFAGQHDLELMDGEALATLARRLNGGRAVAGR